MYVSIGEILRDTEKQKQGSFRAVTLLLQVSAITVLLLL